MKYDGRGVAFGDSISTDAALINDGRSGVKGSTHHGDNWQPSAQTAEIHTDADVCNATRQKVVATSILFVTFPVTNFFFLSFKSSLSVPKQKGKRAHPACRSEIVYGLISALEDILNIY